MVLIYNLFPIQPSSMTMPGSAPLGVIPSHPQVLPHTGLQMQHQDQQSPRGPPGLPQQPRMLAPPQQNQGGPLPNSNQLPQMHPSQVPASNYQGTTLYTTHYHLAHKRISIVKIRW